MTRAPNRRGVAMLLALWTVLAAGSLAALGLAGAAESIGTSENRVELLRASWTAEGCANQLLAQLDRRLSDASQPGEAWDQLDRTALVAEGCTFRLEPSGLTIDINHITQPELSDALWKLGARADADSLADAIVDWRDADDEPLPSGAERAWYVEQGMEPPRNAPFMAREEIALVRGAGEQAAALEHLGVEAERVLIPRAPAAVIATVPGMPIEAVGYVVEAQRLARYPSLEVVARAMPTELRARFETALPQLRRLTTLAPDYWLLTVTATARWGLQATTERRIGRDGTRCATIRRRSW